MTALGWDERQKAYLALRTTLQALRDRLIVEEAAHLGSQLPMFVRGFYYEGWRPSATPLKDNKEAFLLHVADAFRNDSNVDLETVVRVVFKVLSTYIADGKIADVKTLLPKDLETLWPQS